MFQVFFNQLDIKLLKIHIKSAGEDRRTRCVKETANHKMFIAFVETTKNTIIAQNLNIHVVLPVTARNKYFGIKIALNHLHASHIMAFKFYL